MKFAQHISACFRRGTLVALGCVSLAAFAAETPEAAVRASNLADGTGTSLSHRSRNAKSLQSSQKTVVEIADAYRLRQVDVMLEKAKNMPESFFDYVGKTCAKSPYPPLEALYVAEWGAKDTQLPHLDTLPDFEAKIASEVAFARIYGEFLCKSIPYSEVLPELEARMLKRLMGYRSQRMKEGDNEFVKVAEKYLGQWIGHIESAEGFTRTFMHSQRDLLLAGRWRHPEITEGSVGASVVSLGLFWLKTECGYLPKWAKVEFSCSGEASPHDEFHGGDLKAPIDLRRKNELVAIYLELARAYENGRIETLRAWEAKLAGEIKDISCETYNAVAKPIMRHVRILASDRLLLDGVQSADDLHRRLELDFSLFRLYGAYPIERWCWQDQTLPILEGAVYRRLRRWRDSFAEDGREECVRVVDRFMAELVSHVESDRGYSRAALAYCMADAKAFAFQYKLAQQKTWEQVRQTAISNCVGVLLSEGYVPAWLEQFSREPEP